MKKLTTFSGLHCGVTLAVMLMSAGVGQGAETSGRIGTQVVPITLSANPYKDRRPTAKYRLDAVDHGRILRHGDGPGQCDKIGAREAIVFQWKGTYYLHYDGAGAQGWLACLATSKDLTNWTKQGPALRFGPKGSLDSGTASSAWVYKDSKWWHMFYVATPKTTPAPDFIPAMPYYTLKARSKSPSGPWEKQYDMIPFTTKPGTYYSATASPGPVLRNKGQYLMFFSAATPGPDCKRTLGIARTRNLDGGWALDPEPVVPLEEQVENASLYYETANQTWWLFTNHVGDDERGEYTEAVWVYWSKDVNRWNRERKAIVLDGKNCSWSKDCIGLPSVIQVGKRLAVIYDAPGANSVSHMNRDIGLAWLDLPLQPPPDRSRTPDKQGR